MTSIKGNLEQKLKQNRIILLVTVIALLSISNNLKTIIANVLFLIAGMGFFVLSTKYDTLKKYYFKLGIRTFAVGYSMIVVWCLWNYLTGRYSLAHCIPFLTTFGIWTNIQYRYCLVTMICELWILTPLIIRLYRKFKKIAVIGGMLIWVVLATVNLPFWLFWFQIPVFILGMVLANCLLEDIRDRKKTFEETGILPEISPKQKKARVILFTGAFLIILGAVSFQVIRYEIYCQGIRLFNDGEYDKAQARFNEIKTYKSSGKYLAQLENNFIFQKSKSSGDYYTLEFKDDYKLDDLLEVGCNNVEDLSQWVSDNILDGDKINIEYDKYGCTSIYTTMRYEGNESQDSPMMIRNFDYNYTIPVLVHTSPSDGYQSISTCSLNMVSEFDMKNGKTDLDADDYKYLRCLPYIPLDGMNEKGLMVSLLMQPLDSQKETDQNTTLFISVAVRMLLDHADSVDTAVAMLKKINVSSGDFSSFHIHIGDKSGNSVVAEFIDNELSLVYKNSNVDYQVVTNVMLSPGEYYMYGYSLKRQYMVSSRMLDYPDGVYASDIYELLPYSFQKSTQYTICFITDNVYNRDYLEFIPHMNPNVFDNYKIKHVALN